MNMIDPIVEEYKMEMASTRKALERLPDAHWDYKPHSKSMSLGQLASHIAESQGWAAITAQMDEFVMDPATYKPFDGKNRDGVLAEFDKNVAEAVTAMKGCSNESLMSTWTMKGPHGKVFLQMPRIAVIRGFVISHTIHHRGQLTVYLRINDVPLPQIYGPTADETAM